MQPIQPDSETAQCPGIEGHERCLHCGPLGQNPAAGIQNYVSQGATKATRRHRHGAEQPDRGDGRYPDQLSVAASLGERAVSLLLDRHRGDEK